MNKYSSANEITSVFIPRVFANITKERITHVVETVVPLGKVERVDIVNIDEKVNRVFIHFQYWYDSEFVENFKKLLNDETKQAKIVYDTPWYWIVLKNTHRSATGEPKMRINITDESHPVETTPTPHSSPKSTVTFTTGHSIQSYKKQRNWCDCESSDDDSVVEKTYTHTIQSPPPPPYPCPYTNGYSDYAYGIIHPQPYYYTSPLANHIQMAPMLPMYSIPPIAPMLSTIPPILHRQECYSPPPHYCQGQFPIASWNGVSMDETLCDEYEMCVNEEFMLTEEDYEEIMEVLVSECNDDSIYTDEDLYNMEMLEKGELELIYPPKEEEEEDNIKLYYETIYTEEYSDNVLLHDEIHYNIKVSGSPSPVKSTHIVYPKHPSYKDKLLKQCVKNPLHG